MKLRTLALLCTFFTPALLSAAAQDYIYATGTPPYSTSLPVDHGVVNVNNGDIHLEIPLATKQQRGDFSLNEKLVYDSRIWKIVDNGSLIWQPKNVPDSVGGWFFSSGAGAGTVSNLPYSGTDSNAPGCNRVSSPESYTQYTHWSWTDPSGTTHVFPSVSTVKYQAGGAFCPTPAPGVPNSSGIASDGSGYTLSVTNYTTATVADQHGVTYHPSLCGTAFCQAQTNLVTDRNGNSWNSDASSNLIDTSGQTPVMVSSNNNQTFYDVLVAGGSRQRYTVTMVSVPYSTAFNQRDVQDVNGSFNAIQSIALPDGSSYIFTYDSYGELNSMTLPTGGKVTYIYSNYMDSYNNQNRWLTSLVRNGGTTTFTPAVATQCTSSAGCQQTVTVNSPSGDDTVYTFSLDKAGLIAGSSFQSGIKTYSGFAANGALLRSTTTSYTYNSFSTQTDENGTYLITGSYEVPASVTNTVTLADVGAATQTSTIFTFAGNQAAETKTWNFGNAASNPPDTDTVYKYESHGFPLSVVTKDGSGNTLSNVTYGYDETAPGASSGVPNHTATVSGVRSNQTSKHQWISTTSQTLDTTMSYDDAGTLLSTTAPEGKTTYSYDPTDTFVAGTTAPTPSSGATIASGTGYDGATGAVTSTTDPNGQQIAFKNFDAFNRPGEVDFPDGGVTKVSYPDAANVIESTAFNSAGPGTTMRQNDSYGRPSRTAVATGQANTFYQQDTCYDPSGRVQFQSYRYQGTGFSAAKVCSGAGDSYTYDALGRVKQVTHGDGSTIQYGYRGQATQVTDENGVSKITQTDAFGRITAACEVSTDASMPGNTPPASCRTDLGGTGFLTSYSYNPAGFQTTVTQGVQTRVFTSDSLGRQAAAQEPESGRTTWDYAYNGTGLLVTRTKPMANQNDSNVKTTTQTQYDTLGRMVSVNYSDGTAAKTYSYDVPVPGTNSANVVGRLAQQTAATAAGPAVEVFSYDAMGRTTQVITCTPATCGGTAVTQNYTYDFAGNMTGATDGVGAALIYGYTPANENNGIASLVGNYPASVVSNVAQSPFGPTSYQLGNGLNQVYHYDGLGRRDKGWVCNGSASQFCDGGTQLYGFTVTWGGGRVNGACDTVLGNCSNMAYDDLNRLKARTTTGGTNLDGQWSYDRYGNRWTQTVNPSGYQQQLAVDAATNRVMGFAYDAAGNLLQDGTHGYSYDAEGNMTAVDGGQAAKYFYDASNNRVRSEINGTAYELLFNLTGQKVAITSGGAVVEEDTHLGAAPLAAFFNGSLNFEHQDWLGTERFLTGSDGSPIGNYTSYPFGDGYVDNGVDLDPYHFAGMDHDYESTLDHATFREYANAGGRWVSPDPYQGSYDFTNPQSLNRYSYALNDPLSLSDPNGRDPFTISIIAICGGAPGACVASAFDPIALGVLAGAAVFGELSHLFGWFDGPHFDGVVGSPGVNVGPNQIDCSKPPTGPPQAPPGVNLAQNVAQASRMSQFSWINHVREFGQWDYAHIVSQRYAAFGNFNYGATCATFFSLGGCQWGAGVAAYGSAAKNVLQGGRWTAGPGSPLRPANVNGLQDFGDQSIPSENPSVVSGYNYQKWQETCH